MTCTKFRAPKWWAKVASIEELEREQLRRWAERERRKSMFPQLTTEQQDMKQLALFAEGEID